MQKRYVGLLSLLSGLSYQTDATIEELSAISVSDVIYDSRRAVEETVFVCTVGEMHDSHKYAADVYEKGCRVFVVQRKLDLPVDVVQIVVENGRIALAKMAHAYFDNPAKRLHIIGVTGTKGKTTIANLTASVLNGLGFKTGCIGTNGVTFDGVTTPTGYTTPESYELAQVFADLLARGAEYIVMEVSSLGVKQHRIEGLNFDIGVFTNLSPDHIGPKEHATMEEYIACKADLFRRCSWGVLNADDVHAKVMAEACVAENKRYCTYSLSAASDYRAWDLSSWQSANALGEQFCCNVFGKERMFQIGQPGEFSVSNALAVLAVCRLVFEMRQEEACVDQIEAALKAAVVPGRIELVSALPDATVIIDYAHNELSMESLLTTLQQFDYKRLVVLFGSVGCRSQIRRAQLGHVASKYADFCILTSDNPDTEDPMQIVDEIALAFAGSDTEYIKIPDRNKAVAYAISHYQPGDMIVLAGKGHENYQLIDGVKVPFCEKEIVLRIADTMQAAL